jgi:hypothetical protein
MLKTKLIKRGIPELNPIITANGFQEVGMLSLIILSSKEDCEIKHLKED